MTYRLSDSMTRPHLIGIIRDMKEGDELELGPNLSVVCLPQGYRLQGRELEGELIFARSRDLLAHLEPVLEMLPNVYRGLVVSPSNRFLKRASMILYNVGYETAMAPDTKKAFHYMRSFRPDFIAVDLSADRTEGHRMISQVRKELGSHVPIVAVVDEAGEEILMETLKLGADELVASEHLDRDLLKIVRDCIDEQEDLIGGER